MIQPTDVKSIISIDAIIVDSNLSCWITRVSDTQISEITWNLEAKSTITELSNFLEDRSTSRKKSTLEWTRNERWNHMMFPKVFKQKEYMYFIVLTTYVYVYSLS